MTIIHEVISKREFLKKLYIYIYWAQGIVDTILHKFLLQNQLT
jgi:hypothetical protein